MLQIYNAICSEALLPLGYSHPMIEHKTGTKAGPYLWGARYIGSRTLLQLGQKCPSSVLYSETLPTQLPILPSLWPAQGQPCTVVRYLFLPSQTAPLHLLQTFSSGSLACLILSWPLFLAWPGVTHSRSWDCTKEAYSRETSSTPITDEHFLACGTGESGWPVH